MFLANLLLSLTSSFTLFTGEPFLTLDILSADLRSEAVFNLVPEAGGLGKSDCFL